MNEPEERRKQERGRLRGWIKTNWPERADTASECVAVHLQANDAPGTLVGPECGRCEWVGRAGTSLSVLPRFCQFSPFSLFILDEFLDEQAPKNALKVRFFQRFSKC